MFNKTLLATALAMVTMSSAHAGNFVTLRDDLATLSTANGGLASGAAAQGADKFYIENTSATYLAGYDDVTAPIDGGFGNVVATSINYRTFTGGTTTGTGTLTLLDWRVTENVPLLPDTPQATIYDFVYRDSADNKLVFGSRYLNREDNDQEANFLFRYGFNGYSTAAAWTFLTDGDLRLYQAGRTDDHSYAADVAFDAGAVRQKGDFSVSEGNPWSGLYLVKTDAQNYTLGDKAIGFYQAGEENQAVVGGYVGGYVAAPVPEPETYGMMLAGLGLMGFVARRRRSI